MIFYLTTVILLFLQLPALSLPRPSSNFADEIHCAWGGHWDRWHRNIRF